MAKLRDPRSPSMIRNGAGLPSAMVSHTVDVAGHSTSLTLEDAFWTAIREIAAIQKSTISELVSRIDKDRQNKNRSSTIRVFVLDYYRQAAAERHR